MATIDSILPGGIHTDPPAQREHEARANADWYHEERARARKVAALVRDIDMSMVSQGIVQNADALVTLIRQLRTQSPASWAALFANAGQKEPSKASTDAVIDAYALRLGHMVSK